MNISTTLIKELRKARDEQFKVTLLIGDTPIIYSDVVIEHMGRNHIMFVGSFQSMKGDRIVNQLRRQTIETVMVSGIEYVIAEMIVDEPSNDDEGFIKFI